MEKTPPTGTPGQAPSASGADPAAALAKELGLSAVKVRAAMQALAPAGAPPQGAAPEGARSQGAPSQGTASQGTPSQARTAPQGSGSSTTTGSAA
jgi:hypothetical protein